MNSNADRIRDLLLDNFDITVAGVAAIVDAKDERIADLEHQLDVVTAALVKERGVPI